MSLFTIEQIRTEVQSAVDLYNKTAAQPDRITKISLFGSYADGCATTTSDVDLLVRFTSSIVSLFTLAKVLSCLESRLGTSVDVVQDPIPTDSLLEIKKVIPLYEGN